jgi:cytochrome c oxidase assembly protein subunit 15
MVMGRTVFTTAAPCAESMNTLPNTAHRTRNVHRFAVFTACSTFFLLIAGALVTSNDAGLSVPDWPLSYGSLTPPMVGGIFYEHGHRVIAAIVGIFSIVLAAWLWKVERRAWVRWLGVAAVGTVIAQGILGGITVLFFLPATISAAHATLAQLFFCAIVSVALFTSDWWQRELSTVADSGKPRIHSIAVSAACATLLQLILGAAFRHKGFGIIPHLIGAVLVTILIFWLARALRHRFSRVPALRTSAKVLHALIGTQLILGGAAWWSRIYGARFPQPIPVTVTLTVIHTVTGALVLATTVMVTLLCYRLVKQSSFATEHIRAPQSQTPEQASL